MKESYFIRRQIWQIFDPSPLNNADVLNGWSHSENLLIKSVEGKSSLQWFIIRNYGELNFSLTFIWFKTMGTYFSPYIEKFPIFCENCSLQVSTFLLGMFFKARIKKGWVKFPTCGFATQLMGKNPIPSSYHSFNSSKLYVLWFQCPNKDSNFEWTLMYKGKNCVYLSTLDASPQKGLGI